MNHNIAEFTEQDLGELKKLYEAAAKKGDILFIYKSRTFSTQFAGELITYLTEKYGNI